MRLLIKHKLIAIMLLLTFLPLTLLGYFALEDEKSLATKSINHAKDLGEGVLEDSSNSLKALGEDLIKEKSLSTAKQIEIYLESHPEKTLPMLLNDSYFNSLAVQKFGKGGYTAVFDSQTLINWFHPKKKFQNFDLNLLNNTLPAFWKIIIESDGFTPTGGYYDWIEPCGTVREKYLFVTKVNAKTADNITLAVTASTYMDEFSKPVIESEKRINSVISHSIEEMKKSTEGVSLQNTILIITLISVIGSFLASVILANQLTKPINQLTKVANKISKGNAKVTIPKINSDDEIKDLGESLKSALAAIEFLLEEINKKNPTKNKRSVLKNNPLKKKKELNKKSIKKKVAVKNKKSRVKK